MYTIAMAYAGTGNNKAIRKLLHVAVSDVNDDVRRAAVTGEDKIPPVDNIDVVLGQAWASCYSSSPTTAPGWSSSLARVDLEMPVTKVRSSAKPSTYGYTPNLEEMKEVGWTS